MTRISGVDIPDNKSGEVGLTYIYGVGRSLSRRILAEANIDSNKKIKDWSDEESNAVRSVITEKYKIEGELRAETQHHIKRLLDIGCYRGFRHRRGLPVRGQSTKNNARTRKGKRKTVANKKKAAKG